MAAAAAAGPSAGSVAQALKDVSDRIDAARAKAHTNRPVRLVAVSKTKPVAALQEAYDAGQRVFGENYVQEMLDKAPALPRDIQWHFIGHLQSNKVKAIVDEVPNLAMVETVDSAKLADKLNKAWEAASSSREGGSGGTGASKLPVMIQVNTSGEESKYGVSPSEVVPLAQHIQSSCDSLHLAGLMTIGMADYTSTPKNFACLADCRQQVSAALGVAVEGLELSMGMSGDFEQAVEMGSTNVRVGSTIFGARVYA